MTYLQRQILKGYWKTILIVKNTGTVSGYMFLLNICIFKRKPDRWKIVEKNVAVQFCSRENKDIT